MSGTLGLATLPVHDLALFVPAALLLNLTPGPDMLFVAGISATRGRRDGVLAAIGVGAGCLLHVALAAVGLSALLATSAWAFGAVKLAGAAYLVWMGLGMLRASASAAARGPDRAAGPACSPQAGPNRVFWQGALTNALNPKVALFFLAFLPQFIVPGAPGQALAFVLLGLLFTLGGTVVTVVVAWLAGGVGRRGAVTPARQRQGRWLQRVAGCMFVALGLKLALSSK